MFNHLNFYTMYYANFNANNGTHLAAGYKSTNRQKLIRAIRESSEAYRFLHNASSWQVWDGDGKCVAAGGTMHNGQRYRVPQYALCAYDFEYGIIDIDDKYLI